MKQRLFVLMILGVFALPATGQADQYQQRVITTTTLIGATVGAVVGSAHHRTAQGAIIGGMLGAMTGILISQDRPQAAVYRDRGDEYREHEWQERQRHRAAHRRHEWREHERWEHRRFVRMRRATYASHAETYWNED